MLQERLKDLAFNDLAFNDSYKSDCMIVYIVDGDLMICGMG